MCLIFRGIDSSDEIVEFELHVLAYLFPPAKNVSSGEGDGFRSFDPFPDLNSVCARSPVR